MAAAPLPCSRKSAHVFCTNPVSIFPPSTTPILSMWPIYSYRTPTHRIWSLGNGAPVSETLVGLRSSGTHGEKPSLLVMVNIHADRNSEMRYMQECLREFIRTPHLPYLIVLYEQGSSAHMAPTLSKEEVESEIRGPSTPDPFFADALTRIYPSVVKTQSPEGEAWLDACLRSVREVKPLAPEVLPASRGDGGYDSGYESDNSCA